MKTVLRLTIFSLFFIGVSFAQIPKKLSYQGILTDDSGNPLSGDQTLTLKLYDVGSGGTALWEETQNVVVDFGVFNVILGEVTPLNLSFDKQYWLGITVAPNPTELSPRVQLTAAAYSLNSLAVADTTISHWQKSGDNLYYDEGKVFIGRTSSITGAEHFGFTATAGASAYGGMYANTTNANGWPFYGYATSGSALAWHYYVPSDSTWRLYNFGNKLAVKGNGFIGFNNITPASDLHLKQSANPFPNPTTGGIIFEETDASGGTRWQVWHSHDYLSFAFNGTRVAYINNTSGAWTTTSDMRYKNSITNIPSVLDKVMRLKPVEYYYNHQSMSGNKVKGFIAQEVEAIFPEIVYRDDLTDPSAPLGLSYADFTVIAIKAIQEQQKVIEDLQKQIDDLKRSLGR
jgi:hypothetical protein